jgi:ketosteroid isomerase-like protein
MTQMRGNDAEQLVEKWVAALRNGDVDSLRQMTTDTFITIGPLGFLLNKEQWNVFEGLFEHADSSCINTSGVC